MESILFQRYFNIALLNIKKKGKSITFTLKEDTCKTNVSGFLEAELYKYFIPESHDSPKFPNVVFS